MFSVLFSSHLFYPHLCIVIVDVASYVLFLCYVYYCYGAVVSAVALVFLSFRTLTFVVFLSLYFYLLLCFVE